MQEEQKIIPADFIGVYKEIAEVIGVESTIALHNTFQGQQITLPKKLYTQEYILQQVKCEGNSSNIKRVALQFGYTERRLRQIIKENT